MSGELKNFMHYEVPAQAGDNIQVVLSGNASRVLVMDDANFQSYRSGGTFQYLNNGYAGGYVTRSPVLIGVPSSKRWHVVIDLGGRPGRVNASVQVLSRIAG